MKINNKTLKKCKILKNEIKTLAKERINKEFNKILIGVKPSLGIKSLKKTESLKLFSEMQKILYYSQIKEYILKKNTWINLLFNIDKTSKIIKKNLISKKEYIIIMYTSLCLNFGIINVIKLKNKYHNKFAIRLSISLLNNLKISKKIIKEIIPIIKNYFKLKNLYKKKTKLQV